MKASFLKLLAMLLPGLTIGILLIASMIIRFVKKMKRVTVDRYHAAPPLDDETKRRMQAIFDNEDQETYMIVDESGRLVEVSKHPI